MGSVRLLKQQKGRSTSRVAYVAKRMWPSAPDRGRTRVVNTEEKYDE
jgi:hypothetical protein